MARLTEDRLGMVLWRDDAAGCLAPPAGQQKVVKPDIADEVAKRGVQL